MRLFRYVLLAFTLPMALAFNITFLGFLPTYMVLWLCLPFLRADMREIVPEVMTAPMRIWLDNAR